MRDKQWWQHRDQLNYNEKKLLQNIEDAFISVRFHQLQLGYKSPQSVQKMLVALVKKGFLKKSNKICLACKQRKVTYEIK